MNWFDALSLAIVILFAWRGYRRGLLSWLAGLGATILAIAVAILLTPPLAALLASRAGPLRGLSEWLVFLVLLIGLRLVAGLVLREVALSLRPILHALPPLNLVDHLLGAVPYTILGVLAVALFLLAALVLPVDRRLHNAAATSRIGRTAIAEAEQAVHAPPHGGLLAAPAQLAPWAGDLIHAFGLPAQPTSARPTQ